jgi:predicted metal-dependent enzyme (double-stranded beta helix superfamily)
LEVLMSAVFTTPAPRLTDPPETELPGPVAAETPGPVATETLVAIVRGLAAAEAFWRPLVRHDPHERQSVRLLATADYDVWLIGWWPGQRVGRHDHGDALGALTVVEGTLVDATLARGPDGGSHVERRLLRPGAERRLAVDLVHDVQNAGTVPATSIHAYSPPLATMAFYGDDGAVLRRQPVAEVVPVLAGPSSAGLHPSIRG